MTQAIAQMEKVTQTTAATAEESAAAGEEERGEEQRELAGEDGDETDDAFGGADVAGGRVTDELRTTLGDDDRDHDRKGDEHAAHQAVALGGAAEDFGSRGGSSTGHGANESEQPRSSGNPALGRVGRLTED